MNILIDCIHIAILDTMKIKSKVKYDMDLDKCVGYLTMPGHNSTAKHTLVCTFSCVTIRGKQVVA